MKLDPESLRAYANRDWKHIERMSLAERVNQPVAQKVRIAIELYEAMRRTLPEWPDEQTRRADLESHLRVKALLARAAHVGTR